MMTTHPLLQKLKDVIVLAVNEHAAMCAFWYDVYSYYRVATTPEQRNWWAMDTLEYSVADLTEAFFIYRNRPIAKNKVHKPPLPADLTSILTPAVDLDGEANAIAARMFAAISKFGRPGAERAHAFIGEAGWWAVDQLGGWAGLCQDTLAENRTTLTAQWRDLVRGRLQITGTIDDQRLRIEARQRTTNAELTGMGQILDGLKVKQ